MAYTCLDELKWSSEQSVVSTFYTAFMKLCLFIINKSNINFIYSKIYEVGQIKLSFLMRRLKIQKI